MISLLRISPAAVFIVLIMLLSTTNSQAQLYEEQIEALKSQIEEIRKLNQQQIEELRKKIEGLEAQKEADQEKIEELAAHKQKEKEEEDAWWKKVDAGYKDGVYVKTKDGNFSVRTRLLGQVQLSVNDTENEGTATDFNIRRLRVIWDGNAFTPWFLYYIQLEATDDVILRDAYFDAAYKTVFAPRAGQHKVPFSREQLYSGSALQLVERSILDDEFRFGRDRGAGVYGVLGRFITYGVGVFNGDGRNGTSVDSNLLYAARVQFTPCCGELKYKQGQFPTGGDYNFEPNFGPEDKPLIIISVAAAGIPGLNIGNKIPDSDIDERFEEIFDDAVIDAGGAEADVIAFTADANLRYRIFSLDGDYILRRIDPDGGFDSVTDHGFRLQGGVFVLPEFIEVAGRFAYIAYDDDVIGSRDSKYEVTPGLNFYLSKNHKWKLQFSYSFINNEFTDDDSFDENIFRAQLSAYF